MIDGIASHVWQSTLFAGAAALLTLVFRANQAQVRYWIWLSASLKFLIPFALFTSLGSHIHIRPPSSVREVATVTPAVSHTFEYFTRPVLPQVSEPMVLASDAVFPVRLFFGGVWGCGVICLALIRMRAWRRLRAIMRASLPTDLPIPVEVRSSVALSEPAVVGFIRPVVLLPQGITERLTPAEMSAILAHELCHVRRRDNLLAFPHMIVETILWFHPLVWWVGARLVEERERACDEDVVRSGTVPDVYAEAILRVCKLYVASPRAHACGVTGATLKRRIEMIMGDRVAEKLNRGRKALLACAGAFVIAIPLVSGIIHGVPEAAAAPKPQTATFEIASVKPSTEPAFRPGVFCFDTCSGEELSVSGSRVSIRYISVFSLILTAWRIKPNQLSGPEWMKSQRFDIVAMIPQGASKAQVPEMLQRLLSERFRLAIHRERKDQPVFALVVGKNGIRLQKGVATAGAPVSEEAGIEQTYSHSGESQEMDNGDSVVASRFYGRMRMGRGGDGRMRFEFQGLSMPAFAALLTPHMDRPVIDRTDLTGSYQLLIEPVGHPDGSAASRKTAGPPEEPPQVATAARQDVFGERLIQAIEKAGLKLQTSKAPVDMIVVDHIEKTPTPN